MQTGVRELTGGGGRLLPTGVRNRGGLVLSPKEEEGTVTRGRESSSRGCRKCLPSRISMSGREPGDKYRLLLFSHLWLVLTSPSQKLEDEPCGCSLGRSASLGCKGGRIREESEAPRKAWGPDGAQTEADGPGWLLAAFPAPASICLPKDRPQMKVPFQAYAHLGGTYFYAGNSCL